MRGSVIFEWLAEYINADEPRIGTDEVNVRIHALEEMWSQFYRRSTKAEMDPEYFREVMTTAHFAVYFGDALSRAFRDDYQYMTGQWLNYTTPDTAPDFRDVDRGRMTEPGTLRRRYELQDPGMVHISDSWQHYGVEEFAESFAVSWQTLVNDDLAKIQETPTRMARAASRWLDTFVSALYDNAVTQVSVLALGAAYGGTGRLTHANLAIGINGFFQRVDAGNNPLVVPSIVLVIPPILQIQANMILASINASGMVPAPNDANVLPNFLSGVYVDPYIATTALSTPWYLFAAPSAGIPTVTVVRLAGWPGPIVAQETSNLSILSGSVPGAFLLGDFEHGEIRYLVEDIVGGWDDGTFVGVTDVNGIYYSNGTTP